MGELSPVHTSVPAAHKHKKQDLLHSPQSTPTPCSSSTRRP